MFNPKFKVSLEVEFPGYEGMTNEHIKDMEYEILDGLVKEFGLTFLPGTIKVELVKED